MAVNYDFGGLGTLTIANGDETFLMVNSIRRTVSGDGVELAAGTVLTQFHNHGTVLAAEEAVKVFANESVIINHGTIEGLVDGIDLAHGADGSDHRIVNYGRISTQQETIDVSPAFTFNLDLTNYGEMVSWGGNDLIDPSSGLGNSQVVNSGYMRGGTLDMSGSGISTLTNSGTIITTIVDMFSVGTARVNNTGDIIDTAGSSGSQILRTGNANDFVTNSGSIVGSVDLNGGADIFRTMGDGFVSAQVDGGLGDDTLLGGSDNDQLDGQGDNDLIAGYGGSDTLVGGTGNDTMFGGAGEDSMEGNGGSDRINTGSGDDTGYGGSENDTLAGQDGDDYLEGEGGSDILDGGAGVDTLIGGDNDDILRGRAGVDFLTGGQGLDVLTGGEGADVFVYEALADSTPNASRDVILDFQKGLDAINLVQVIPGVFSFRGTAGFTATGTPELRLQETAAGSTIVRLDADGNGSIDMEINVAAVQGLTIDDFVL